MEIGTVLGKCILCIDHYKRKRYTHRKTIEYKLQIKEVWDGGYKSVREKYVEYNRKGIIMSWDIHFTITKGRVK